MVRTAQAKPRRYTLADEVAFVSPLAYDDILLGGGPEYAIHRDLLDFMVAELHARRVRLVRIGSGRLRTLLGKQLGQSFGLRFGTGRMIWRPWPK